MNLRRIVTLCALAVLLVASNMSAQTIFLGGMTTQKPWNNYVPAYIPDGFASIIGSGGTLITGTDNRGDYNYVANLALPFPFYFLGTQYTAGYNLKVGTNGYLGFNGSSYVGGPNYEYYGYYWYNYFSGSNGYPSYSKCIFVYATNLVTTGVADGGVYYRVDGASPNRKLIVEWRVGSGNRYSGQVGNFQVVLSENTGKIQYFYGSSSINVPYVQYDSYNYAVIGIKNLGETYYYGGTNPLTGSRNPSNPIDRYYIFANTELHPTDTIVYTGLPIISYFGTIYADIYNFVPGESNKWQNYGFPTSGGSRIGLQMSPVFDDMATDSLWLTPTVTANAFGVGSTITVNARFRNIGVNNRTNVPVQVDVYRNGSGGGLVYSSTTTNVAVSPGIQFASINAAFTPAISSAVTNLTGVYTVKVYTKLTTPIDQDFSNDTIQTLFYVTKPNDVMAFSILQPFQNLPPLNYQYPVGTSVPIEVRFLNIGTNTQYNVPIGYTVFNSTGTVMASGSGVVAGAWQPIAYKDITFSGWTPTVPGRYYLKAYTLLPGDENPFNDTLTPAPSQGWPFDVAYEIEVSVATPSPQFSPRPAACYPIGKPITVLAQFLNDGVSDATNIPVNVTITNAAGQVVYNRNVTLLNIVARTGPGNPGLATQAFPDFIPTGSGTYTATATTSYPNDPVPGNNSASWTFCVKPPLIGTIRVGAGERFKTIQEATDSVTFYGVGGNVIFELVDDNYTVPSPNSDPSIPALDWRRKIVGAGPNATVTFMPNANKTMVTVNMQSYSGIGMWFGQLDTVNPSGYVYFDGTARKTLTFTYQNQSTNPADLYQGFQRSIPFFYGRGASNYGVRNSIIRPFDAGSGKMQYTALPAVSYNSTFNQFTYVSDYSMQVSAGILMRNSLRPSGAITSTKGGGSQAQATIPDTLRIQNNAFENNTISGFGYGVASIGLGPLYNVGQGRYAEYNNQNNKINGNTISNVSRAGVMMVWEKNTEVINNSITNVDNSSLSTPLPNTAGIWVSSGGNATNNRGYSTDLRIERNQVSRVFSTTANAAGVFVETAENVFISPSNVTYRFPTNGATNMQIWNNMVWNVRGQNPPNVNTPYYSIGIGMQPDVATRIDFVATGNKVQNNTIYNQVGGTSVEFGILANRSGMSVMNNIVALTSQTTTNKTGVLINAINAAGTMSSDYNLFYVPNGSVGTLQHFSQQGFALPSMPPAQDLYQWRNTSKMDMNSVSGNITGEFMSTNPGSENLHLNPTIVGGLASNRGSAVTGLLNDVDNENRNPAGSTLATPDIGADEYNGAVFNYDLKAEDITSPLNYRALTGQYSDADYVMIDSATALTARVRNVGGQPLLNNTATLTIDRWTGSSWVSTGVSISRPVSVNVASVQSLNFGTFQPQSLMQVAQNDAFWGLNPNVTPVYRIRITTGGQDQNLGNDIYEKTVRFYVQRSTRRAIVGVKYWAPTTVASTIVNTVDLGNKLNGDTVIAALNRGGWDRANGVGTEDFDLFERDKWPTYSDNFKPWKTVIWAQGQETSGLDPWERSSLKEMLDSRNIYDRSSLVVAGQDVARLHDVALTASNGMMADQDFVRNYLRTQYVSGTTPALYNNLRIKGVKVNADLLEVVKATAVGTDVGPTPAIVRATAGNGVAYPSHKYIDLTGSTIDTASGIATFGSVRNAIYYAIDWRHMARLSVDNRSGAMRMLMGALDQFEQNKGVLPIRLLSFEAYQTGRQAVSVNWQTSLEVDVTSMEIERAEVKGGEVGTYSFIDRRSSQGSAVKGAQYGVVDQGVEVGSTYSYRLVSIGLDGSRVVEGEQQVKIAGATTGEMELSVSPNPTTSGKAIVSYASGLEKVRVTVYDVTGKQVMAESRESGAGKVELSGLSSGVYTVVLEGVSGERVSRKLVVQN